MNNRTPMNPNNNIPNYSKVPHQHLTETDSDQGGEYANYLQGSNYAQLNSFQQNNQGHVVQQPQDQRNVQQQVQYPALDRPNFQPNKNPPGSVYQSIPPTQHHHMVQHHLPNNTPTNNLNQPGLTNYTPTNFELMEEKISIQMPNVIHKHVFKKLFPHKLSQEPFDMQCPACNRQVTTKIDRHFGAGALGCTLGLLVCCAHMCWLPFCMKDCHDMYHRCPECGYTIATEKFLCK